MSMKYHTFKMLNKTFTLFSTQISVSPCAIFLSLDLKRHYFTPRSPSCAPNSQGTQMGQSTASDVLYNAPTGAHTHSSMHCAMHVRGKRTHMTHALWHHEQRKAWLMTTAGPEGAQRTRADEESRQTRIARGPQGCPLGAEQAQPRNQTNPEQETRGVKSERVWQVKKCKDTG